MKTKQKRHVSKIDGRARFGVTFLKPKYSIGHEDDRRVLLAAVGNFKFPFPLRQIKFIEVSAKAAREKLIIGNHRHMANSGQWEIAIVMGDRKQTFFHFYYKNREGGKTYNRKLRGGDTVIIPPGCTLAFLPLRAGARLLEISNKEYDPKNYVKEIIF